MGMTGPQTFEVRYDWDARARAWSAVSEDPRVASGGRTLIAAQANFRDAVATWLELPDEQSLDDAGVVVIDHVVAPEVDPSSLVALRARREQVEALRTEVATETAHIAATLRARGLTIRDIGDVIGISHTRVAQLVGKG